MQYDVRECLLQLFAKIYPNSNDDCMFKISKLQSTLFNNRVMNCLVFTFRGIKQCSNNEWNVTSDYGSKWIIIRNLQMFRWASKVEYINKTCACHTVN